MWVVIRNDELAAFSVQHTDTLDHYRARGWVRVSEPAADKDSLHPSEYEDAPDMDAEPEKPTKKTAAKQAPNETEEK